MVKGSKHTQEENEHNRQCHLGKKHTEETKKKISASLIGNQYALGKRWVVLHRRNPNKSLNLRLRNTTDYKEWRMAVYMRDNFTCQECGQKGKKLNADHIKPFVNNGNIRFDINNGRTLCVECHKKTDTYGWKMSHFLRKNLAT